MSTPPTVLPVDAPPPIPTVSPYPNGIASFYYPGYAIQATSQTFDSTKPSKSWSRPLQPGENPASLFGPVGYFQGTTYIPDQLFMTKQAAADTNIVPASAVATPAQQEALAGSVYMTQSVPIPARAPLATESVNPVMGMIIVTNSAVAGAAVPQTQQEMDNSQNIAECLKILRAAYPNLV